MSSSPQPSILFVCLGNICRSPLAEGVCRYELAQRGLDGKVHVDSCGTGGWHVGESPDPRSVAIARRHGIDISKQRGRQLAASDYHDFQFVVAMDSSNYRTLVARQPGDGTAELIRFMSLINDDPTPDVPDPYYGEGDGFVTVWNLLSRGMDPLLERVAATLS